MKKGLAYIGGPKQLLNFIWYYLAYGKEFEWDLVCQPMSKDMGLKESCLNTGIFNEIYMPEPYITRGLLDSVIQTMKMIFFWLVGKNKKYARSEIGKFVDIDKYDKLCLSTVRGVTCGMMALCFDGEIDLMEDGYGDNTDANIKFEFNRITEHHYLVSFLFAKMGYCNPSGMFPVDSTKKCKRFTSYMQSISKELYKSVHEMNDMTIINKYHYNDMVEKTFRFNPSELENVGILLFTTNLNDFTEEYNSIIKKICECFENSGEIIGIKRHPRDNKDYQIKNAVMIDRDIPAEMLIEYFNDREMYFMFPSATIEAIHDRNIKIFKYCSLYENQYYRSHFEDSLLKVRSRTDIKFEIIEI